MLNKKLLSAAVQAAVGPSTDANFKQTVLLLHGDGTNGAQNNTFIAANAAAATAPGGFSGYFDGSGDFLSVADNAAFEIGSGNFTAEAWIYLTGYSASYSSNFSGAVIGQDSATSRAFHCLITGTSSSWTSLTCLLATNNSTTTTTTASFTFSLNTWYHVAYVRNGTSLRMYVNGVDVGGGTNSTTVQNSTANLTVGSIDYTGFQYFFPGYLSNVRFVKGTAVYTSNFTPPSGNLTAISGTSLLTCQSATFVDNSTNNFTVTANGNATVATESNSGLPITRNGNTTQGTFTPFSQPDGRWSNYFDGSGDILDVANNVALQLGSSDFTIEFFTYVNSLDGNRWIFGKGDAATAAGSMISAPISGVGSTWDFYYGSSSLALTRPTLVVGQWQHVAVVRNGASVTIYLNGSSVSSGNLPSSSTTLNTGGSNPFRIGGYAAGSINGYISNVRVVKGTAVYTANFTPSTSPLTAITNTSLLTCQSNRFVDNSTNAFAITRNGDVRVTAFGPFAPTAAYDAGTNGGSGYFDGTGDYLTVPTSSAFAFGTGDFTVEYWINIASGNPTVVDLRGATGTLGFTDFYTSGAPAVFAEGTGTLLTSTVAITYGSWNHVAYVRSGTTLTIYVNGVSGGSVTNSTNWVAPSAAGGRIGSNKDNASLVTGYISNVRILKGTAQYTTAFTPPTAPLTAITNTSLLLNFTNAGIIDSTGKNVLETVGNAQIDTTTKKFGTGALEFDGSGDYLLFPSGPDIQFGSGNFTIEFWFYSNNLTSPSAFQDIIGRRSSVSVRGLTISLANSTIGISAGDTSTTAWEVTIASGTLSSGTWYHYAVTREGSSWRAFLNGTQIGSTVTWSGTIADETSNWFIGARATDGAFGFNGFIDDLRITKGVARYTADFTPPTAPFEDQ